MYVLVTYRDEENQMKKSTYVSRMMLETLANSIRSIIYTLSSQLFYAACSIILCHIALQVIKN